MPERLSKIPTFVILTSTLASLRFKLTLSIKRRPLYLVLTVLMLIGVCLLVYVMHLLLFRGVCLLSFMVSVRRLWRSSWMISPSMEPPLTTVSTILIKFCRDAKKQTWCSIGRSAISWLTKGSFSVPRFPRGELKWARRRLKLLKECPIQGISKVFVVFSVMLVSIEDLSRTFLRPRDPSLIFSRRMFLLYLMKIVRKPSKFLRNL